MKNKIAIERITRLIILLLAGLILGLLVGHTSIFGLMALFAVTALVCVLFAIIFLINQLSKEKSRVEVTIIGQIALAFIISMLASIMTMNYMADSRQKLSEELILKIEAYKNKNATYPDSLVEITTDEKLNDLDKINYSTDSIRQSFTLRFSVDGWHYSKYDSKDKRWIGGD